MFIQHPQTTLSFVAFEKKNEAVDQFIIKSLLLAQPNVKDVYRMCASLHIVDYNNLHKITPHIEYIWFSYIYMLVGFHSSKQDPQFLIIHKFALVYQIADIHHYKCM